MKRQKRDEKKLFGKLLLFVLPVFIVSLLIYQALAPLNWGEDNDRYHLVVVGNSGYDVALVIMDRSRQSTTVLSIPPNTEVNVSRDLGRFSVSSLWALAESEDIGGELVAETLVKSFSFPVDGWVGDGASAYQDKGFWKSLGVFGNHSSSLSMKDKIKIFNHFRSTSTSNNTYVDLRNTGYLTSAKISGGDDGYVVKQRIPPSLVAIISDDTVVEEALRVGVVYQGVYLASIERVSNMINALGNRVISVRRGDVDTLDCVLYGEESVTKMKISRALDCKVLGESAEDIDIEIHLGELFSDRF